MTSNGGTLHGVPQSGHSCSQCGLIVDSLPSLQVHMQYHHENAARWGQSPPTSGVASSTTPTTPTDTETNNNNVQPLGKHNHNHIKAGLSPQHHQNTIAAADSSDNHNNPPTPQPTNNNNSNNSNNTDSGTSQTYSGGNSPYGAQQHTPASQIISPPASDMHYPTYYDQYYHHGVDYGSAQVPPSTSPHLLNNGSQQQEYKTVPSTRYHPYINSNSNSHSTIAPINGQSVQITNNGLSPRVVSSTSPTQNSLLQTTTTSTASSPSGGLMIPPGQPTPSPSPKQCDKCGVVCETDGQLIEHSATAHPGGLAQEGNVKNENSDSQSYAPFAPEPQYIKDEPSSNILDLDSQKMVYPQHHEGALPPMHSLHHLQSMQRHSMMWGGHDPHHGFIPPHPNNEIKSPYFHHQPMKPEYPPTPPIIKNEYLQPTHMKNDYGGPILPPAPVSMKQEYHIKSEYNMQQAQAATDINESGNQLTTSPSDFPSTTTPQENGTQFRSFEPPSSSLPASKGTSWKSNEARRPKTYNCTACNKWFTSSGHLKRHYNTTLHKNAVKSSGQPDPATLPISAHHHPNRDPNYMGKRRSHHRNHQNAQQQQQQQQGQTQQNSQQTGPQNSSQLQSVPPGDDPRSPDYQPQFTLPSFGSTALPQGFQQYSTNLHNSTPVPPNGEAGPSVQASQPRDLQTQMINSNNLLMLHQQELQQQVDQHQAQDHISTTTIHMPMQSTMPLHMPLPHINSINSSMDQQFPLDINTNIHTSYIITEAPNYHHTIGSHEEQQQHHLQQQLHHLKTEEIVDESLNQIIIVPQTEAMHPMQPLPSLHPNPHGTITSLNSYDNILSRFTGGAAYQGDMAPPFSPDIPEQYHTASTSHAMTAYQDEDEASSMPQSAAQMVIMPSARDDTDMMAPSSPSVSSTLPGNSNMEQPKNEPEVGKHKCLECDKVFNKSCYLTQHNKTCHSGDKPFKCQRCGKRFPCGASHEEHFAKHGNNKPFKCEVCPKAFNHKTDLRRHMCLHSGTKPYACEECGKGFIRKDHMLKHTETHRRRSSMQAAQKKAQLNKPSGKKREPSLSINTNDSSDSALFN